MDGGLVRDPVYHQLNRALRRLVAGRRFRTGDRFLTEREVCREYSVSRPTANKALSTLVAEGVLEFRKGVGTFVRGGVLDYDLRSLVSFTERARACGKKPATRVLESDIVPARMIPPGAAGALRLGREDLACSMVRLRLADGVPVILERRWVVSSRCPGLERADLSGSLYALWTERYRLRVEGADQTILAVLVEGAEARALKVRPGSPGLLGISTGFLEGGAPLWHERTLYRGDAYAFQNRLGGIRRTGPAVGTFLSSPGGRA
jgi:GntR family transcriptional regulator